MKIVAFDIDGTLTKPKVRAVFKELSQTGNMVGIITGRGTKSTVKFISEHNLQADFIDSGVVKLISLSNKRIFLGRPGDKHIYVGNSERDKIATTISDWQFISADEVTIDKILGDNNV